MNIFEKYMKLSDEKRWEEALPVILEILSMNDGISTSWFNYGACLKELKQYDKAAEAFKRSYSLEPGDYGSQFHVFHSYALADNAEDFSNFLKEELPKTPEIIDLMKQEDDLFGTILSNHKVQQVIEDYYNS